MIISGLQKTTLIDFPDEVACTIFLGGCNFRCGFCYNPGLARGKSRGQGISAEELGNFLKERKNFLDGVCISGGEPTLHEGLEGLCRQIKEFGLKVKLDTNGSKPEVIESLLRKGLVDYIAMDIKAPLDRYGEVAQAEVDAEAIVRSIGVIKDSGIAYEFRSTLVPALHSKEDVVEMAGMIEGAELYCLQQFSNNVELLEPKLRGTGRFTIDELRGIAESVSHLVKRVEIRGAEM